MRNIEGTKVRKKKILDKQRKICERKAKTKYQKQHSKTEIINKQRRERKEREILSKIVTIKGVNVIMIEMTINDDDKIMVMIIIIIIIIKMITVMK